MCVWGGGEFKPAIHFRCVSHAEKGGRGPGQHIVKMRA